jgi:hypothetical protein
MADQGFSHLYFTCKNYKELAQARITKVVGYFTTDPAKLVSHFSDFSVIFYKIYKNQPKALHYLRFVSQQGPWKVLNFYICALALRKGPQEDFSPRNRVPGRRPAAVRPNSGEPPAGAGRARAGEVPRGTRGRVPCSLGAGRGWRGGCAGGQAREPLRPVCRRGGVAPATW